MTGNLNTNCLMIRIVWSSIFEKEKHMHEGANIGTATAWHTSSLKSIKDKAWSRNASLPFGFYCIGPPGTVTFQLSMLLPSVDRYHHGWHVHMWHISTAVAFISILALLLYVYKFNYRVLRFYHSTNISENRFSDFLLCGL